MITLKLYGRLKKRFGAEYRLDVVNIPEAIRALCYQLPEFEKSVKSGTYRVTRVSGAGNRTDIDEDGLFLSLGRTKIVEIRPVAKGNKRGGLGKIILGVVLIGAAFFFAPAGASLGGIISGGGMPGMLAQAGIMATLNGVAQMLSPQPHSGKTQEEQRSHILDATGNRNEQGGAVPVIYGEVYTGSVVVSSGMSVEEFPINGENGDETLPVEFSSEPDSP